MGMYMREYWVQVHQSPIVYRYIDWSPHVATSFNNMRMIVTVGWAIYPAGYLFGYLLGAVDDTLLNVIYNVADFVNKIAFVCACWSCAKADSAAKAHLLA